jgi:hypothetical protein
MSQKTSIWTNHAFITGLIAVAIALVFLSAVAPTVQAINTAGMPTWEAQLVGVFQLVVDVFPAGVLAGFGWSLFGYLREMAGDTETEYDLTKLSQTVLWFVGIITPVAYGLNNVALGTGIATAFMTLKAVVNQFVTTEQNAAASVLPAGTSPTPTLSSSGQAEGVSGSSLVYWTPGQSSPPAGTVQVPWGLTFAQAETWIAAYHPT